MFTSTSTVLDVEKAIPLKQGLKHNSLISIICELDCRKGNSIKTRIETLVSMHQVALMPIVEKAIPLKQGLKHGGGK